MIEYLADCFAQILETKIPEDEGSPLPFGLVNLGGICEQTEECSRALTGTQLVHRHLHVINYCKVIKVTIFCIYIDIGN